MRLEREAGQEGPRNGESSKLCHAQWTWSNMNFEISSGYTGKSRWERVLMSLGKRRR